MKLGTLLLRDGVITLSQLEAALRAQVLYGGRLGTNLVELDFVHLDTLGRYLSVILDVPLANQAAFEAADPAIIEWFGAELADLYTAFPLGYEADTPGVLGIVFAEPTNRPAMEQLATQCGQPITPYVAPELRLFYYLEKHYGLSRKARYIRTGSRRTAPSEQDERRRTQPAGGMELPPSVKLVPKKKKKRAETEQSASPPPAEPAAAEPAPSPPAIRVSFREACNLIDAASHRDQIGRTLVDFAVGRFGAAVVFLLRDGNALGWRVHTATRKSPASPIDQLTLPLGGASVLEAACDSGEPYRGGSPSAAKPIETKLWQTIGSDDRPEEMLVVPVKVKQRVVNLIYVHGLNGGRISDPFAEELIELARHASDAYVRLIRISKAAAREEQPE